MTYLFSNTASIFQSNGSAITLLNPLPVTLGSANITVVGNTNIIDTVTVYSTPENPVHTHVTEVGTSGNLQVPWMPIAGNVSIDGNANVKVQGNINGITTLPGITGNVRVYGNVNVDNFPTNVSITQMPGVTGNVGVYGNVSVTQLPAISGNVNVTQLPGVTGNVGVYGNVSVTQLPAISGNVNVTQLPGVTGNVQVYGNVNVDNFPSNVSITQLPGVTGNVHIYGNIGGSDQPITVNQGTSPWITSATTTILGNVQIGAMPASAISAFEELLSAPITPLIQSDANYGLDPDVWKTTTLLGGNVTVADTGLWTVSCNTAVNSYARLFTSRYAKYLPGQGMMARWTAAYTVTAGNTVMTANGVVNCVQVSGPIDREDGYAIGFSGNSVNNKIGIQHRRAGKVEIRQFTITTYNTGTQTVIFTLNGVPYTITLPATTSTNAAATKIAQLLRATDAGQYWNIDGCTSVLTFAYYSPGAKSGTYSMSTSGTGTLLAGTFTPLVTGQAPVDTWYYQDQWDNRNITIDPAKLNVYAMDMRWLGAGAVRFFVEEPTTGKMVLIHTLRWTQNQTGVYPHVNKPNLRISYRIGSITGAQPAQNATLSGASVMLATQGLYNQTTMSQGWYNVDSSNKAQNTVWHLMTIQNPYVRGSVLNKSQLVMQDLTVSAQGNDPMIIYIVKNAAAVNDPLEFQLIPGHGNPYWFAQYSVTSTYTSLGSENINNVQTLGINGSSQFDLLKYNLTLAPGDTFSVFITSTNAITRTSVGATWRVD